jgi:hypothetical protein
VLIRQLIACQFGEQFCIGFGLFLRLHGRLLFLPL